MTVEKAAFTTLGDGRRVEFKAKDGDTLEVSFDVQLLPSMTQTATLGIPLSDLSDILKTLELELP